MRLTVNAKAFAAKVRFATQVCTKRSQYGSPVTRGVLLRVMNGVPDVVASDLDIGVIVSAPGTGTKDGMALVSPGLLVSALRSFGDAPVVVESDGPTGGPPGLVISEPGATLGAGGKSTIIPPLAEPSDFPIVLPFPADSGFACDARTFREAVNGSTWATSSVESRYEMQGALISWEKDQFGIVATDGKRMRVVSVQKGGKHFRNRVEALISPQALKLAQKAIGKKVRGETVEFIPRKKVVHIRAADVQITARRIEGAFPSWEEVIPANDGKTILKVERQELIDAIAHVSAVASDSGIELAPKVRDGALRISAGSNGNGAAVAHVQADVTGTEEATVKLNPRFLRDYATTVLGDSITLHVDGSRNATRWLDDLGVCVIMPITTEESP